MFVKNFPEEELKKVIVLKQRNPGNFAEKFPGFCENQCMVPSMTVPSGWNSGSFSR